MCRLKQPKANRKQQQKQQKNIQQPSPQRNMSSKPNKNTKNQKNKKHRTTNSPPKENPPQKPKNRFNRATLLRLRVLPNPPPGGGWGGFVFVFHLFNKKKSHFFLKILRVSYSLIKYNKISIFLFFFLKIWQVFYRCPGFLKGSSKSHSFVSSSVGKCRGSDLVFSIYLCCFGNQKRLKEELKFKNI